MVPMTVEMRLKGIKAMILNLKQKKVYFSNQRTKQKYFDKPIKLNLGGMN